jgi:hypothetical protein
VIEEVKRHLIRELVQLRAELAKLRPVYEAAKAWGRNLCANLDNAVKQAEGEHGKD